MYNPLLATFIMIADCGSFNKAARKLYLSPTAVMKQMNTLEKHLDLSLIERTSTGIHLTEAGRQIYHDARYLIEYSQKALQKARATAHECDQTFCIGTSLLNPAKPFIDLWYQINRDFAAYKLHLVPFTDNHQGILSELSLLGKKFDFIIGVCDAPSWLSLCQFLPLGRYQKMVAVSREHPLAHKKKLTMADLAGQTLMMVPKGASYVNDAIRNDLERDHPEIHLEDTPPFYDLSVFNRCAETDKVLLTIECWQNVHPGLVSIPVDWPYSIPYGLLYSSHADLSVLRFAAAVKNFIQAKDNPLQ